MTHQIGLAARWWAVPPPARVSRLAGAEPELLELALDPLPPDAPAFLFYRPPGGGSATEQTGRLLDVLDRAAVALFPHWLPGAEKFDGVSDGGSPRGAGRVGGVPVDSGAGSLDGASAVGSGTGSLDGASAVGGGAGGSGERRP